MGAVTHLPVDRLSDADQLLHLRLQKTLSQLQVQAATLQSFVSEHLAEQYKLQQGDTVEDDGTIVRAPKDESGVE